MIEKKKLANEHIMKVHLLQMTIGVTQHISVVVTKYLKFQHIDNHI